VRRVLAILLAGVIAAGIGWEAISPAWAQAPGQVPGQVPGQAQAQRGQAPRAAPQRPLTQRVADGWRALFPGRTGKLRVRVVDMETGKPIDRARCVLGETRQELWTAADGWTATIEAPIIRDPRLHRMLAQLAGQLTLICYKTGYRDSIFMGVRMHEGLVTEPEVHMIPILHPGRRAEPWLYQMPIHRTWRIQLTDTFRSPAEPGAGPERPER
jgi:hypothetical protein